MDPVRTGLLVATTTLLLAACSAPAADGEADGPRPAGPVPTAPGRFAAGADAVVLPGGVRLLARDRTYGGRPGRGDLAEEARSPVTGYDAGLGTATGRPDGAFVYSAWSETAAYRTLVTGTDVPMGTDLGRPKLRLHVPGGADRLLRDSALNPVAVTPDEIAFLDLLDGSYRKDRPLSTRVLSRDLRTGRERVLLATPGLYGLEAAPRGGLVVSQRFPDRGIVRSSLLRGGRLTPLGDNLTICAVPAGSPRLAWVGSAEAGAPQAVVADPATGRVAARADLRAGSWVQGCVLAGDRLAVVTGQDRRTTVTAYRATTTALRRTGSFPVDLPATADVHDPRLAGASLLAWTIVPADPRTGKEVAYGLPTCSLRSSTCVDRLRRPRRAATSTRS